LLYASASKGFRIGGVNPPLGSLLCLSDLQQLGYTASPRTFNSDNVWNYEVGAKGSAIDRTLTFEVSAFYIKWKNIQTSTYLPNCALCFTSNAPAAWRGGFDISASARVSDEFTFTGAFGYVLARYDESVIVGQAPGPVASIVQKGDRLPGSPY